MIRIRRYARDDRNQVLQLCEQMHAESRYSHLTFSEETVCDFIDQHVTGVSIQAFVANHNKAGVVGFVCMSLMPYIFTPGNTAIDLALYVKPAYRNTLAFAGLVRAGERWAIDNGAHSVMFGVSAPSDVQKACRAYRKLGYKDWGVILRKETGQ